METYSFGEWLKGRRERLRLTQRELALTVHCSAAMLKKIEADERRPSPELATLLAAALNVTDQALFTAVARGEKPVDVLWDMPEDAATGARLGHAPEPLPGAATPFIGRVDELQAIRARLADDRCRLLVLVGPGGIGKTRLALSLAHTQQTAFADGAAFVSLAALTDAEGLPGAIARSLRLVLGGSTSMPAEQVTAFLRRRRMLLILDNCEQLQGDLSWLSDLLEHAPGVKVMGTSRERLHLAEEWVYVVPEMAQATTLFVEAAQRIHQNFDAEAEQREVRRICELVGNLPLAVELAASWTPIMSCAQIVEHIARDISLLATDARNVPERHRSIQAVFDHSWNLLTSAEQDVLMRLTVFRGGWQAEQASAAANADLLMLRRLVEKFLVRVVQPGRYDLHELIRQYGAQRLSRTQREDESFQRHFDVYLELAAQLNTQQFQPGGMDAVARFEQEHDNFRAALAWSLRSGHAAQALKLLYHLWFLWARRGYYYEGAEWGLRAIAQAGTLENPELCLALSSTAALLYNQGRYAEAEPLAVQSLALARRLEDAEALIHGLATLTFTSVNIDQALQGLQDGINLIHQTGKAQEFLPMLHLGAASWLYSSGRYPEAAEQFSQSITLFRKMDVLDFVAEPLGGLGTMALQEGRLREAYNLMTETVAAARTGGYDVVIGAWGSARLGLIHLYLGDPEAAHKWLGEALDIFEEGQDTRVKQETLAMLSEVAVARGDVQAAAHYLQASLSICDALYRQLQSTGKLGGSPEALPIDLIPLCARASLVAAAQKQDERAAALCGIADMLQKKGGQMMLVPLKASVDHAMEGVCARLGKRAFDSACEAGQQMSLAQAFTFLLS